MLEGDPSPPERPGRSVTWRPPLSVATRPSSRGCWGSTAAFTFYRSTWSWQGSALETRAPDVTVAIIKQTFAAPGPRGMTNALVGRKEPELAEQSQAGSFLLFKRWLFPRARVHGLCALVRARGTSLLLQPSGTC